MTVKRFALLFTAGLLGYGVQSSAETITQEGFLAHLRQTHPLFEKEKLTAQIEQQERASYLGNQDWNVQSSFFFSHEEPSIAFAGPERTNAFSVSGGVERLFWKTGGRLSATFSSVHANLKIDPLFGFPDSYFENRLAVSYIHPLLKNKNGQLDRLQYDLKQFDIDFSEVIAIENQEDFLARSTARFLDWVFLTEQQRIVTERLRLSEEELANTQQKRAANLIDEVDVIRAEDAVRIARQNLLLIESQWKALQSELAVMVQDTNYYDATPEYDIYETETLSNLDKATTQLKAESRLLKTIVIRLEQLETVRSGFVEIEKPDLSLIAQVGLKNAETAFGSSLAMDKSDALIGLQLSFPIGNRTAKSKIAQTDLQTMQLEKQLEELTLDLTSAVANVHIQIGELEHVLELNREQIQSAQRKTEEELRLYNQGRGQLTFVIQSRDSEQAAKLTYAANALTYHKLLLQYGTLMDQLYE